MPIKVILQNIHGETRGLVTDGYGGLNKCLPVGNAAFPLLQYVDPYGNTIFNKRQMPQLLEEIGWLLENASTDDERLLLDKLRDLAQRCWEANHLYLRFRGD